MIRLPIVLFLILGFARPLPATGAEPAPSPGATLAAASPAPEPMAVPMADVVTQADAVEASLQEMQPTAAPAATASGRDLPAMTREISAQLRKERSSSSPECCSRRCAILKRAG